MHEGALNPHLAFSEVLQTAIRSLRSLPIIGLRFTGSLNMG